LDKTVKKAQRLIENDETVMTATMTTTTKTKTIGDDNGYDNCHNHNNQGKRFIIILKDVPDSKELN
jgi:hypothetical protein